MRSYRLDQQATIAGVTIHTVIISVALMCSCCVALLIEVWGILYMIMSAAKTGVHASSNQILCISCAEY